MGRGNDCFDVATREEESRERDDMGKGNALKPGLGKTDHMEENSLLAAAL